MVRVEAEHATPIAQVQIARYALADRYEQVVLSEGVYRVDMSVTPRPANARARYSRRWHPGRYEKLGAVYLLPPGEEVLFRSEPGATTCIVCELRPEALATWFDGALRWTDPVLYEALDLRSPRVRAVLRQLGEELRHPGFAGAAMIELLVAQLAIELGRSCSGIETGTAHGLAGWRLRRIDERLREAGPAPTLAELAALCNLSVRQLTRGFRLARGCSIGDVIAETRIAMSKGLLGSERSIKAVARDLGFGSPSGFASAFRKLVGCTPREYRHRLAGRG